MFEQGFPRPFDVKFYILMLRVMRWHCWALMVIAIVIVRLCGKGLLLKQTSGIGH